MLSTFSKNLLIDHPTFFLISISIIGSKFSGFILSATYTSWFFNEQIVQIYFLVIDFYTHDACGRLSVT